MHPRTRPGDHVRYPVPSVGGLHRRLAALVQHHRQPLGILEGPNALQHPRRAAVVRTITLGDGVGRCPRTACLRALPPGASFAVSR
jgi:hypothetical protein